MLKSTSVKKGCKISIKFPKLSAGFILKISPKTDDYKATDEKFVQCILKISSLDKVSLKILPVIQKLKFFISKISQIMDSLKT